MILLEGGGTMSDLDRIMAFQKAYHHGRCDVGSPFATGQLYDLEEE